MRILVFGRTGQVARELALEGAGRGIEIRSLGREEADLCDPESCARVIAESDADAVINAAAYTAVDRAESEPGLAAVVNGAAPAAMAMAAADRGLPLLHVSTDYVFDGREGPAWSEDDPIGPLSVYGRSKLMGERGVTDAGGPHVVLRTEWVFSAHGGNFVKTMLRLARERDEVRVVDDQLGGPTPARDIARALLDICVRWREGRGESGLYHFSGAPTVSWAEFARSIFALSTGPRLKVVAIPSSEFPMAAQRPLNSVLNCDRIRAVYGIAQPDWRAGLRQVMAELEG
jgi:dTDP-4-dehydrorhamnose reductase